MKKFGVIFCLLYFFSSSTFAQETRISNLLKNSQFGILMDFKISNEDFKTFDFGNIGLFDELQGVESKVKTGFSLGILNQYQFRPSMSIRTQGVISFMESTFFYDLTNVEDVTRTIEMVRIETPIHLIFENTKKKVSPSFFVGAKYSYNIAHNNLTPEKNFHRKDDVLFDVGTGVTFTFKRFKFKPELVYSRGLLNQVVDGSIVPFSNVFEKINGNQFSFRLVFFN